MLVVAAAGMVVAGGTAYLLQRERTLAQIDDRLASAVNEADFIAENANPTTYAEALTAIVQRLRPGTDEATFALVDGRTAIVPGGDISIHPERDPAFVARIGTETADAVVVRGTAETTAGLVRYVAIPVAVAGDSATGVFVVTVDLRARLKPIDDAFVTFAIVAAAALVALGLVGWGVAGRLLAPIRRLRDTAARITASDVSERIDVVGADDVSELTITVNDMLDRLESALTGQRQLLDDVGHELKTPITIVRGQLELMQADDAADVASTRDIAIDELDRMNGLVRDISELAVINRPLHPRLEATDVAALTASVRTKASALSPAHEWVTSRSAAVVAELDPARITQALLQLAANAVTHGSPTGRIEIDSSVEGDRLVFRVSNDGPAIAPESAARIFERFGRGTTGRGIAGSGLGLAIVTAIAKGHGGVARVEPRVGGPTFAIDIPLVLASQSEEIAP
ncbi:MAG: sensor histidine kinase [Rhodoglobus sp.]|nr:sensor histidine kinase [Rhodoglobus sp.]